MKTIANRVVSVAAALVVALAGVSSALAICQASGKSCGFNAAANDRLCCPGTVCGWGNVCQPGCRINGVFYPSQTVNPANDCQGCRPSVSTTQWSNLPTGTTCGRPSVEVCDRPDTCNGGLCFKHLAGPTVMCRDAAGPCDTVEFCTGGSVECPADLKRTGTCRPPDGECDPAESCDGASDTCPPDVTHIGDVTGPGDPIVATSNNSPGSEGVANAIDDQPTKYLNFDMLNTGLTVTPTAGPTVIHCLSLTAANDAPERDPASFVLSGSNNGVDFTEIAQGPVPAFPSRFSRQAIPITNTTSYSSYKLIFPTVANPALANSMQISEVELLCGCPD